MTTLYAQPNTQSAAGQADGGVAARQAGNGQTAGGGSTG
jgi:hypothetical protein